jgi:hypothetical protein
MRKCAVLLFAAAAVFLTVAARHHAVTPPVAPPPVNIDIRRSLVITDPALLGGFDFQRVLQALIDRSGATSTTPLSLYQQWFDTQNPKPGLTVADAPHCDDFLTNGKPSFNGFPRRCPTPEGILATSDPFAAHDYTPIGITNRFDLTPADGSNCGQYRIIFAKTTSSAQTKLHIIFEPTLRNPNPSAGVAGCRAVAQFWADLSKVDSADERRARIEKFFFDGIDGFDPVLTPGRFAPGLGRIRTAQNAPQMITRFYQFHLQQNGARLLVVPGLLENLPYGPLYSAAAAQPLGPEFRQFFLSQIQTLAIRDVNGFFDEIPDKYLIHESVPDNTPIAFASDASFNQGLSTPEGQAFKAAVVAELQRVGSTISVNDLLTRADLQNCQGCHLGGVAVGEGLTFPFADGGTHVDERMVNGNFAISPALRDVFAPNRAKVLTDFLSGKPLPVHTSGTIGGGRRSD